MVLFNAEELEVIASAPPHNFSKEGLLYMKPLSKKASKKAKKTQDGKTARNVFDKLARNTRTMLLYSFFSLVKFSFL